MYSIKSYRRAIRLTEGLEAVRSSYDAIEGSESKVIYGMRVQVKVGLCWLTLWHEQCAPEDGDARLKIRSRANDILKLLGGDKHELYDKSCLL